MQNFLGKTNSRLGNVKVVDHACSYRQVDQLTQLTQYIVEQVTVVKI